VAAARRLGLGAYLLSSMLGSVDVLNTIGFIGLIADGGLYLVGYMRDEGKAPSKYNPQSEAVGV
jgi:hypothetical protein